MKQGFSLVELSIVLVILGLLTGGILAGQSLIRAAELRSVSTDLARYKTAVYSFRDKYFALPGDMTNATGFWGDQATSTGACASVATADGTPGTCNGNGDGILYYTNSGEPSRAWQHLAMAGLVEGNYSGIGILDLPGQNVGPSKISGAGVSIVQASIYGFLSGAASSDSNKLVFGKATSGTTGTMAAILKPEENWNIDTKLDDGNGYTGSLRAWTGSGNSGSCLNGTNYTLDNAGVACFLNLTL
jgi:prepilin-type N-terminal cleavage/methylation domain-containing protein